MIDDLIEARRGEVGELHFDDGAHPRQGRPDGSTDHRIFTDGSILDPAGKLRGQIPGRLERTAKRPNILPVDENPWIVRQRLGLRFANGFEVSNAHFKPDNVRPDPKSGQRAQSLFNQMRR